MTVASRSSGSRRANSSVVVPPLSATTSPGAIRPDRGLGDGGLGRDVVGQALDERVGPGRARRQGPAVDAAQQARIRQLLQVAAHGVERHPQPQGEIRGADLALGGQPAQDELTALFAEQLPRGVGGGHARRIAQKAARTAPARTRVGSAPAVRRRGAGRCGPRGELAPRDGLHRRADRPPRPQRLRSRGVRRLVRAACWACGASRRTPNDHVVRRAEAAPATGRRRPGGVVHGTPCPAAGSDDLCFAVDDDLDGHHRPPGGLRGGDRGRARSSGPAPRGAMTSVYCRDPDGSLIEVSTYR